MPTIQGVTTKSSEQVWQSPDGQRKLYRVTFEYEGKDFNAKSYSEAITAVGWTGDVLLEDRPGKQGPETFAKQAPKEGFTPYGGSGNQSSSTGKPYGTAAGGKNFDSFTMYLSYAKDVMVAQMANAAPGTAIDYTDALDAVIAGGYQLYNSRPDAEVQTPAETKADEKAEDEDIKAGLEDFFSQPKAEQEKSWNPSN